MSRQVSNLFAQNTQFFRDNPEQVEINTSIRPGQSDYGVFVPEVQTGNEDPELLNPLDGSVDGSVRVGWFNIPVSLPLPAIEVPEVGTAATEFNSKGSSVGLSASPEQEVDVEFEIPLGRRKTIEVDVELDVPSSVVTTEKGFGVASFEDLDALEGISPESAGDDIGETLGSLSSIGGDESLDVEIQGIFQSPFEEPEQHFGAARKEGYRDVSELEGRDLSFSFEVVGGTGEIVVTFVKDGSPWVPPEVTVQTFNPAPVFDPFLSGGARYRTPEPGNFFDPTEPEGGFDEFSISTTGDLEIIVTGINLTTGMGDEILFN